MSDDILVASEQALVPATQEQDDDSVSNVSFTETARQLFNEEVKLPWYKSEMKVKLKLMFKVLKMPLIYWIIIKKEL